MRRFIGLLLVVVFVAGCGEKTPNTNAVPQPVPDQNKPAPGKPGENPGFS